MADDERREPERDPLQEEQEGKGYGEDEGERAEALDEPEREPPE